MLIWRALIMVRRSLLILATLATTAMAGEIKSARFLYTTGEINGTNQKVLELEVETEGQCPIIPIKREGKTVEVLFKGCPIPSPHQIDSRGDFIKSAYIKPSPEGSIFVAQLTREGTLHIKPTPQGYRLQVVEGRVVEPNFSILKTPYGEQVVIELPPGCPVQYERVGNRFLIMAPGVRFKSQFKKLPSQLVDSITVKNNPGGGVIELSLSPQVAVAQASSKNGALFVNLYKTRASQSANRTPEDEELKVALKFTNADVKAVVRAIANVAKINVVFDPEVSGKVNVDFKKPVYWKDALRAVLEPLNLTYIETPEYYRILPKEKLVIEEVLEPVRTYTITLNFIDAQEVLNNIKKLLQSSDGKKNAKPRETVTFNKDTNTLILKVTERHYKQIKELIQKLDKPRKQVLVKAKIVQLRSRAEKNLGFTWFISGYNYMGKPPSPYFTGSYGFNAGEYTPLINPADLGNLANIPVNDSTLAIGLLNKSQTFRIELALKALEIDGDAQIISSPKVLTLDNQEASIEQGVEIPYRETTVAAGGATTYNISFKKASLILKVKPHITKNNKIILDLEVRKDSPNYDYVTITGASEPAINTRNVKSKIIMDNGSTVVIGGIYEKEKSRSTTGVPVLSRIPLLGWLFKNNQNIVSKYQLLIFITPTLVSPEGKMSLAEPQEEYEGLLNNR